tara:strand:+ start:1894 stop:2133 length:240 start_codon:yes stop_codon:yes gene_type:complete
MQTERQRSQWGNESTKWLETRDEQGKLLMSASSIGLFGTNGPAPLGSWPAPILARVPAPNAGRLPTPIVSETTDVLGGG